MGIKSDKYQTSEGYRMDEKEKAKAHRLGPFRVPSQGNGEKRASMKLGIVQILIPVSVSVECEDP